MQNSNLNEILMRSQRLKQESRENFEKHRQNACEQRETREQFARTCFENMMLERLASIDDSLRSFEVRIQAEVEKRVTSIVTDFLESDALRNMVDERVAEICGASSASTASCCSSTCADTPSTSAPEEEEVEPEPEPSCSSSASDIPATSSHYPNKWEFISTLQPGEIANFRLEQFTDPVRTALKMTSDEDLFPRMSLEEMIERDHPTTSDCELFDEKKITCRNRPQGKVLTDEEFFCLAPCCSDSRLFQAASCPFLPSFVKKRMVLDECGVLIQTRANGIELITPVRWQVARPIVPQVPPTTDGQPTQEDEEDEEEDAEDENPLANREIVEQLMHEFFIPTPSLPTDDYIFGPYLQKVRESDDMPVDLLRALVRRVNSNLDNSYENHQQLELFSELDQVEVDEKYGRITLDPLNNSPN
ncbi:unnamed protein product [Caenorhabditis sp. 36 PRJEB53466]|nr:unnamed protein product [Caenorhabditis sp. 36 PRJEB53466]